MLSKIAIIGAGVSGLTSAQLLTRTNKVTVFEKESTPGGLIRCNELTEASFIHVEVMCSIQNVKMCLTGFGQDSIAKRNSH